MLPCQAQLHELGPDQEIRFDPRLQHSGTIVLKGGRIRSWGDSQRFFHGPIQISGSGQVAGGSFVVTNDIEVEGTLDMEAWIYAKGNFRGKGVVVKKGVGTLFIEGNAECDELHVTRGDLRVNGTLTCNRLVVKSVLTGTGTINCPNIEYAGEGESQFSYKHAGHELPVMVYRPKSWQRGNPVMIVLTGSDRRAGVYRKNFRKIADERNALLFVPEFNRFDFRADEYIFGGLMKGKAPQPRERWLQSFVAALVEAIREREGDPDLQYYLIGHSAGAQALSRVAAFHHVSPLRPKEYILMSGGSYLFPELEWEYSSGLKGLPDELRTPEVLKAWVGAPISIICGTGDTKTGGYPDQGDYVKQGLTRIERARNLYATGKALAEKNGWPFGWRLYEVEGGGHDSSDSWKDPKTRGVFERP